MKEIAKFMIKNSVKSKTVAEFFNISVSSIYYHHTKQKYKDKVFYSFIKEIANSFPFYGCRRIHRTLRSKGHKVNHERVYRIYKELNLQKVKFKQRKKVIISVNNSLAEDKYPNHVWSIDFAFDEIENGKRIKIMPVCDIFSRFCIQIKANYSICSDYIIELLEKCFSKYGKPEIIRTDNGGEFRSKKYTSSLTKNRIK